MRCCLRLCAHIAGGIARGAQELRGTDGRSTRLRALRGVLCDPGDDLARAHYRFSRRYGLEDSYTVLLNMVLLFLVLFYVYPLKFVFTVLFSQFTGSDMERGIGMQEGASLMRLYAAGFTAVFAIFALMHAHAYKLRTQLQLNALEILQPSWRSSKPRSW